MDTTFGAVDPALDPDLAYSAYFHLYVTEQEYGDLAALMNALIEKGWRIARVGAPRSVGAATKWRFAHEAFTPGASPDFPWFHPVHVVVEGEDGSTRVFRSHDRYGEVATRMDSDLPMGTELWMTIDDWRRVDGLGGAAE